MEKKKRIIRENNNFSDNNQCDGIIHINESIEEYVRENGLISMKESWDIIDKHMINAANKHGLR